MWRPDGNRLRELREARDLSQRELARLSTVDAETIADIEAGRRRRVQSRTLKKLAAHLLVDWEDLLAEKKKRRVVPKRIADELLPRSSLDLMRYAEREAPEPPLETRYGQLRVFGVAELVDTFVAPRVYEGDRYYVYGEVAHQRALSPADESILDVEPLEGGRFELARKVSQNLPPFALTVFSRKLVHTRTLQQHWRSGKPIQLIVRVVVATTKRATPDAVEVTNLEGGAPLNRDRTFDEGRWSGFELISAKSDDGEARSKPHPWCLVVEDVVAQRS
jgi:transcriptional regulator with XRE-family HTH domain